MAAVTAHTRPQNQKDSSTKCKLLTGVRNRSQLDNGSGGAIRAPPPMSNSAVEAASESSRAGCVVLATDGSILGGFGIAGGQVRLQRTDTTPPFLTHAPALAGT